MVIKTREELDQRIADGWSLTKKKNKYFYLQKKVNGKMLTEKISDEIKDYAEELYHIRKLEKKGIQVDKGSTKSEDIEKLTSKAEENIMKASANKIIQKAIKHIDKRTEKIIEWGTWVDNHVTTIAPGSTWDEKAEQVLKILQEMFQVYLDYDEIANELQRLRQENEILRDTLQLLKKKVDPIVQLRELIKELSRTGNTELVENLVNKYIALTMTMLEKKVMSRE